MVTPSGMLMLNKEEQLLNVLLYIAAIDFERITSSNFEQVENAYSLLN